MMEINDGEKLLTLLYFVVGRGLITVASAPMALPIVGHNYIPVDNVQSYAKRQYAQPAHRSLWCGTYSVMIQRWVDT